MAIDSLLKQLNKYKDEKQELITWLENQIRIYDLDKECKECSGGAIIFSEGMSRGFGTVLYKIKGE